MTTKVPYLDDAEISDRRETEAPINRSRSGYGRKIPTQHMLRIRGRWHRVYVIQISNAGSAYVLINKEKFFLRASTL
jgi:hypothetical protein